MRWPAGASPCSGLGHVGSILAMRLAAEGAVLTVTDVNPVKRALADTLGATWVEPESAHRVEGDLFVPAGVGGVLTDQVIDELRVKAVVGPANNQLAARSGAERLRARGIIWAPDFVVNAGGVIFLSMMNEDQPSAEATRERVDANRRHRLAHLRGRPRARDHDPRGR